MRRELVRENNLPSFRIDISELGALWNSLDSHFDDRLSVNASLLIELPSEELTFYGIDELRSYKDLPDKVNKFRLSLSGGGRHITVNAGTSLISKLYVRSSGDSEAWCAGANEIASAFINRHKTGYAWFIRAPIGWVVLSCYLVAALFFSPQKAVSITSTERISFCLVFLFSLILYWMRSALFPKAVLVLKNDESFVRRYMPEITLVLAIITLLSTVAGWFFSR